ncbi:DUF1015 family protein [Parvimonas sp. D2]|uniref:DUF1015 family protein n=1 Tax=unclassified Parvimonas TaxID=1151464 RepID=UPI002B48E6FC|nr:MULTISPECIES: DUF1015 family protein [unclassified Parvimonas]MEB3011449.1 DUF1015 family protein [Parvimonas sp. D2]MEB3086941.1 DUF1015 family protein [Parvimonas sp. D4]
MKIKLLKNSFINISNNLYDSDFINLAKINDSKICFDNDTLFLSKRSKDKLNSQIIERNNECIYVFKYYDSYGILADLPIEEYVSEKIKCHELVLPDVIQGMISNYHIYNSETAPVFIVHKEEIDYEKIISDKKYKKDYHFDNIDLYVFFDDEAKKILKNFLFIEQMYVADGHHRLYASSMLKNKNSVFSCFLSFSQVTISPIHRMIKDIDATSFDKAKIFMDNFLEVFDDGELKKGYVRITYQGDSFLVKLKDTENDLFWNNDVYRMNTQIISTAFRILNFSNVKYIGDTEILFAKKNLNKNDVLIELCPLDPEEFMELANEVCILPPKSTFFIPKFPSFLVFKKYK